MPQNPNNPAPSDTTTEGPPFVQARPEYPGNPSTTDSQSLRNSSRLPPSPDSVNVVLRTRTGHLVVAQLVDEAVDGLAIAVRDVSQLAVGSEVEVTHKRQPVEAIVRYIQPAGIFHRVGVEWVVKRDRPPALGELPTYRF